MPNGVPLGAFLTNNLEPLARLTAATQTWSMIAPSLAEAFLSTHGVPRQIDARLSLATGSLLSLGSPQTCIEYYLPDFHYCLIHPFGKAAYGYVIPALTET